MRTGKSSERGPWFRAVLRMLRWLAVPIGVVLLGSWIVYQVQPAVYVRNETGRNWESINFYHCWSQDPKVLARDVNAGAQAFFLGRCECWGGEDNFDHEHVEDCVWQLSITYQDTGEEVSLIRYWTPRRAPLVYFWRDRRLVLTVHEDNGVEITQRIL